MKWQKKKKKKYEKKKKTLLSWVRRNTNTNTATAFPLEQMLFMGKEQEFDREKDAIILITLKLVWSVLRTIQ